LFHDEVGAVPFGTEMDGMQHLRHGQQKRSEEPGVHLIVLANESANPPVGLLRRGLSDSKDFGAGQVSVLMVSRPDEEPIAKEIELDWQGSESDGGISGGRDVGVAVAHQRDYAGQLDDNLMAF